MGKVYEAEERLSRRRVALKVLRPELGRSEEGRRLFLNEMNDPRAPRSPEHRPQPGLHRGRRRARDGARVPRGRDAARAGWPRAGACRGRRRSAIAADVAAALAAAHGQEPPIVHRDLKPENLMVIARRPGEGDGLRHRQGAAGDPQEHDAQRRHAPVHEPRADRRRARSISARDLYCLGLVLYEALAGRSAVRVGVAARAAQPPVHGGAAAAARRRARRSCRAGSSGCSCGCSRSRPTAGRRRREEVLAALEPFVTAADVAPARPAAPRGDAPAAVAPPLSAIGVDARGGGAAGRRRAPRHHRAGRARRRAPREISTRRRARDRARALPRSPRRHLPGAPRARTSRRADPGGGGDGGARAERGVDLGARRDLPHCRRRRDAGAGSSRSARTASAASPARARRRRARGSRARRPGRRLGQWLRDREPVAWRERGRAGRARSPTRRPPASEASLFPGPLEPGPHRGRRRSR